MPDGIIFGMGFLVVFCLAVLARYLDRKAGNEGLIMIKTKSVTTVRNGWSRD